MLLSLLLVTACQAQPPAPTPPAEATASRPATLKAALEAEATPRRRIEAEVGDAVCTSDAQCRTLPIGARACGGPESWMAYSVTSGRPDILRALSDELAAMQRQRNQRFGIMSTCQVIPDPGATCRDGRCVLRPRPLAN